MHRNPCFKPIYFLLSCREKKDAEIVNLEGKKNQEMDDLRELEQVKKNTQGPQKLKKFKTLWYRYRAFSLLQSSEMASV